MPIETASEPARFSYRTDPCRGHVATSHAFGSSQSSAKNAVTAGIADSSPIATHRIRHATGFLQTTLSKLPRQSAQQVQLRARGSPDRVLTFIRTYHLLSQLVLIRRLERSRWRGGRCACDTPDIMGFREVPNRLSPCAVKLLQISMLQAKVDSIPIA
jgi:hypothetical protein